MMRGPLSGIRPSRGFCAALVALLAIGVYVNTLENGFAFDDNAIIKDNAQIHDIGNLGDVIVSQYWPGAPRSGALYRPLTVASYTVDWALWNGNPSGFHAVNILLHAGIVLLIFAFLVALGAGTGGATLGAAVFAVHPVHVEAVANVVGRAELFAAFCFLAACLLYLRRDVRPWLRVPGIAVFYLLALGGKEIAVTLPVVLLLLEVAGLDRACRGGVAVGKRIRGEFATYAALGVAACVYLAVRWSILGVPLGAGTDPAFDTISTTARLATMVRIWPEYARLFFFPRELVADYGPAVILPVETLTLEGILGILLATAAFATAAIAWRRARLLSVAVLWFTITILPVSNLLFPIGVMLAERTLYLPSVAVALGAGVLVPLARRGARRDGIALATLTLLALSAGAVRTWTRNPVWKSTNTVVADLFRAHPESFRAQWLLGRLLIEDGKIEAGLHLFRRASALVPTHFNLNLQFGTRLLHAGRPAEAEVVLRRARAVYPQVGLTYVLLSQSLLNQQRPRDAVYVAAEALANAPRITAVYHQMALALASLEEWDAARLARLTAMTLSLATDSTGVVDSWVGWSQVASIHSQQGRIRAAEWALEQARARAPAGIRDSLTLDRLEPRPRSVR